MKKRKPRKTVKAAPLTRKELEDKVAWATNIIQKQYNEIERLTKVSNQLTEIIANLSRKY